VRKKKVKGQRKRKKKEEKGQRDRGRGRGRGRERERERKKERLGSNGHTLALSLHGKDLSAHLKHRLKALTTLDGVLSEALNSKVFNAILDLLPASAKGSNLSGLLENGARVWAGGRRTVDDGFAHREEIVKGHVHTAHGDALGSGIDVGGFVDMRDVFAAEEGG
jgi:hypothetical protein